MLSYFLMRRQTLVTSCTCISYCNYVPSSSQSPGWGGSKNTAKIITKKAPINANKLVNISVPTNIGAVVVLSCCITRWRLPIVNWPPNVEDSSCSCCATSALRTKESLASTVSWGIVVHRTTTVKSIERRQFRLNMVTAISVCYSSDDYPQNTYDRRMFGASFLFCTQYVVPFWHDYLTILPRRVHLARIRHKIVESLSCTLGQWSYGEVIIEAKG